MAVVVGEAAVRIRGDADAGQIESDAGGPVLDALGGIGKKGAALLGGLLGGAALGAAFGSAMENAALDDKFAARLGSTPERAGIIGQAAGNLYAGAWGDSMEDVYGAVEAVTTSIEGMSSASGADLEAMTARALDFATAFDVDVAAATETAGSLIRNGLAADGTQAFDLLTASFQRVPAAMREELPAILDEYGTNFAALGFSGEQAFGILTGAAEGGAIVLDKTGDALKEFTILGTDMSESSVAAYEAIGLSAEDMAAQILAGGDSAANATQQVAQGLLQIEDPVERANASIALFGSPLEDLGTQDIPAFLDSIANVGPGLDDAAGSVDALGVTLNDNASTNLTSFGRQAQALAVDFLGGQLLPAVERVASFLAVNFGPAVEAVGTFISGTVVPALQAFAQWVSRNQTPILVVAGIIAAVFLPHLIAMGVQSTIAAAKVAAAWVVTQAGAIRAAVVHSAQIVRMVAGWVVMGTQSLIQAARVAAAWLIAMGPIGLVIAAVIGLVTLIVVYFDEIVAAISAAWEWVKESVAAAWDWIVQAVTTAIEAVVGFVTGLPQMIWDALVGLGQMLWDLATAAWNMYITAVTTVVEAIIGFVTGLPQRIWDALVSLGQTLWDLATSAWQMFDTAVDTAVEAVVSYVTSLPGRFVSGLSNIGSRIAEVARSAWQWFKDTVVTKAGELLSYVGGLPGRIASGIGNLGRLLFDKGKDLIQGLVDGIASAARFVGNVAKNIVNGVIGFINDFIIDGINDLLEFSIAGITINPPDIPHIPKLHEGGVFDSGRGEGLALLRDNELVATPEQHATANDLLRHLLAGRIPGTPGQATTTGSTVVNVTENVYAAPGQDEAAIAARATQGVVWNLNSGITRRVGAGAEAFA